MDMLALAWLLIIAFAILMYIVLDGFALGVGMLFPFLKREERDIAMSVLLPTWDGNQTWLVFALAAFYGMFPIGFAYLFPKIYLPAILLALMLLFRGICFEFRLKSKKGVDNWDKLFAFSSVIIAFIHGYLVGQLVVGYDLPHYQSGVWFKVFAAAVLIVGYILLGATRLFLKTEGSLWAKSRKVSLGACATLFVGMVLVGLFTLNYRSIPDLGLHKWIVLSFLAALTLIGFALLPKALFAKNHRYAYWLTVVVFVGGFLSMLVYIYPYIVPYHMTYSAAKASNVTLAFTLIAAVFLIPLLLLYTSYAYYIFRGKVKDVLHY